MNVRLKELINPNLTNFSISFLVAGLLWAKDLISATENNIIPNFISTIHLNFNVAWLGLALNLIVAYILFRLLEKYTFIQQRTFLPFFLYILLAGCYPHLHVPTNGLIATIFLVLCMWQIFSSFHQNIPIKESFNAGIFLSIGYFFCFDFLFLIPALYISLYIYNQVSVRTLSSLTLGLLVPVTFVFGLSFWFGKLDEQTNYFINNIPFHFETWASNITLIVFLGIFTVISLITITSSFQSRFNLSIPERKNQQILSLFYIFTLIILWLKLSNINHIIPSFLSICSLIFSIFFSLRSSKFNTTLFVILIVLQIIILIINYCGVLI